MKTAILVAAILLSGCLEWVFWLMYKPKKQRQKMTDTKFVLSLPGIVMGVGFLCSITCIVTMLGFTLFTKPIPHPIFYIFFGLFLWLGMYLVVKPLRWKVIVVGEDITVHPTLGRAYTFRFEDIVSAVRQTKNNKVKSERIVIKTRDGRKTIVESTAICYQRFAKRVQSEVGAEKLKGFKSFS